MRAVLVSATSLAIMTAAVLIKRKHEVVIVEMDRERIDELSEELDCGFLHSDGNKPGVLREADPEQTDILFCLTDNDQTNIIASLVGRSLGFARTVTKIEDTEFEHIWIELGLEDTIVPAFTIVRHLAELFEDRKLLELSSMIKDEARVYSFVARAEDAGPADDLGLPKDCRIVCLYRNNKFRLPDDTLVLQSGDEILLVTQSRNLEALRDRFRAPVGPIEA